MNSFVIATLCLAMVFMPSSANYFSDVSKTRRSRRNLASFEWDGDEDLTQASYQSYVGIWKVDAFSVVTGDAMATPTVDNGFIEIFDTGLDFTWAQGFIDAGFITLYPWSDMDESYVAEEAESSSSSSDGEGEDGEDGEDRRLLSERKVRKVNKLSSSKTSRVLSGEDGEDGEDVIYTYVDMDGIPYFELTNGYNIQVWQESDDTLSLVMWDSDDNVQAGYADFNRWDGVWFYNSQLWGTWVDDSDAEVFSADWDGISIEGGDSFDWYEVNSYSDTAIDYGVCTGTCDADGLQESTFDRAADATATECTYTVYGGSAATVSFDSDANRKASVAGTWVQYNSAFTTSDGETELDNFAELAIDATDGVTYGASGATGTTVAWTDIDLSTTYYTGITFTAGSCTIMAMITDENELGLMIFSGSDEIAEAGYVIAPDGDYDCETDNMGCETGTLLESGLAINGDYIQRREFGSEDIQVRRNRTDGTTDSDVISQTRNGGSDTFDLVETLVDDDEFVDLCAQNTIWFSNSTTQWILVEDGECYITLTPFRGVKQSVQYTYSGTADEFAEGPWIDLATALCTGIQAVVSEFQCSQIGLLSCTKEARRRNRFRFLASGDVTVDYAIAESDDVEFSDDDLTDIAAAGETAATEVTITGVTLVAGSFASESVAGDDIDFDSSSSSPSSTTTDDTTDDGPVFGTRNIFSVALMIALCLIMGLLGQ